MLLTITASIQGKRRFTLNSVTCALKSAFAPIFRVCYILSTGVKVTHRFHTRSQIRCAIYIYNARLVIQTLGCLSSFRRLLLYLYCMPDQDTQAFFFSPRDVSQRGQTLHQFSDQLRFSAFFILPSSYLPCSVCACVVRLYYTCRNLFYTRTLSSGLTGVCELSPCFLSSHYLILL